MRFLVRVHRCPKTSISYVICLSIIHRHLIKYNCCVCCATSRSF
ncbi:hypothetical protein DPMN_138857 [Dreissena polymorpha]|uniref:Uncharacterized protein n=1 Tax=Dreissena polymorpha TaxID=45954 RepID=A0A9D4G7G0_DREPO|nr:hypothetical protein DPMN_138857 [Dreissena polymorpha]